MDGSSDAQRARYGVGIVLLLLVVLLWTGSNFVTQDIFEEGFNKPFLVTYLNTASFSVYLLPFAWRYLRRRYSRSSSVDYSALPTSDEAFLPINPSADANLSASAMGLPPLTTQETWDLAKFFVVVWFLANWTVNAALRYTSVASATILASTSGFFTLIIGRIFHVETTSLTRIGAVMTSFIGVILVSRGDYIADTPSISEPSPSSPLTSSSFPLSLSAYSNPLLGDFLALLSATFYALYVILLKVRVRSESRMDMQLFFGFVGLINIFSSWTVGLLLHLTGVEVFEFPRGGRVWGGILLNMFITFSSDYLYVLAMLKTTPLIVTVGLSLTIPCALLGDALLLRASAPTEVVGGAMLVVVAFIVIGVEDNWNWSGWTAWGRKRVPAGHRHALDGEEESEVARRSLSVERSR